MTRLPIQPQKWMPSIPARNAPSSDPTRPTIRFIQNPWLRFRTFSAIQPAKIPMMMAPIKPTPCM
jgi:hypothetical protein